MYCRWRRGGHFSRNKTLHKICDRFYWRDMTKDKDRVYIHSGKFGGKVLSKKVNTAALKFYNERPKEYNVEMKSDVDKKTKVKFDISSEKMNAVVLQGIDSTKQQNGGALEYNMQSHKIISEQLHSSHLLRLWRTGAGALCYSSEEDQCHDVS